MVEDLLEITHGNVSEALRKQFSSLILSDYEVPEGLTLSPSLLPLFMVLAFMFSLLSKESKDRLMIQRLKMTFHSSKIYLAKKG